MQSVMISSSARQHRSHGNCQSAVKAALTGRGDGHLISPLHPSSNNKMLMLLSSIPQRYGGPCRTGEGHHCDLVLRCSGKESAETLWVYSRHLWQLQQLVSNKLLQQVCLHRSMMPANHLNMNSSTFCRHAFLAVYVRISLHKLTANFRMGGSSQTLMRDVCKRQRIKLMIKYWPVAMGSP